MNAAKYHGHHIWRRFRRQQLWLQLKANKVALISSVILLLLTVTALLAPWLSPFDPSVLQQQNIMDAELPPAWHEQGDSRFLLGTDGLGRDLLSSLLHGIRTSLWVGFWAVLLQLTLGTVLGLCAGYFGGWMDRLVMRLADFQLTFSSLMLAILVLAITRAAMGAHDYHVWSPWLLILVLGLADWPQYARTLRASVLAEKHKDYVAAAQVLGYRSRHIMVMQILPNTLSPLLVIATLQVAHVILAEAALSFLGIGMPYGNPSLGGMMGSGFEYMLSGLWWIALMPGIALVLLLLSINLVADWLRDALDPKNIGPQQ
ncbi:MAG: ABC transporter permease [Oceanospirillaceae bacterium]|jgi:peptide/nickel transport system permease protein|nr:ABC transporter permease [Oceanospirillaceae bacterium]MBT4442433.1 ABC transporter permease [Oceanospirillaceae bacterium]MBT6077410.1 ABC transporter permease [Oceanospirillaceae bacterium]